MLLSEGSRLGHYEILEPIGAGGMGEVYRARDPRVGREVAVKISAEHFSERFDREARAIASLNHPNICTLHDVGPNYLVMELVEGPTLAERIQQGPMPLDEALGIALQIASALETAHDKGIVHRDLKPGNIKIKPDGAVKVLDFGLAKVGETNSGVIQSDNSPTLTAAATQAGMILGTAAYMAPEQARGKTVDRRADIWAFGVVLYEMLAGKRLFQGDDVTETIASVVKEKPDFDRVPAQVRRLLESCLEKDPKKRLQSIGDMRFLLEDRAAPTIASSRRWIQKLAWPVAALAVLGAAGLAFIHFREAPAELAVIRSSILAPENTSLDFNNGLGLPALSPDGKRIVFGARTADGKHPLWVRSLDGLAAQALAGTDGATFPFWSPDSRFIAFFADGKLKKIDAAGGPAITLTDAPNGRGGTWSRDGVILFAPSNSAGPLLRVSQAGGTSKPVSSELGSFPSFLPDGQHFIFQEQQSGTPGFAAIRVGSLDGSASKVIGDGSNTRFSGGHLLFVRDGALMAQPFDLDRMVTNGEAVPIAEQVQAVLNSGRVGVFTASETGLLAYREGMATRGSILNWVDRDGKPSGSFGDPATITGLRLSPDGKSVATEILEGPNKVNIWIYDISRGIRTRFTVDSSSNLNPVWSADGRNITFRSNRKGHFDLYRKAVDSLGSEELLYADDMDKVPSDWSPDGKLLLYAARKVGSTTNYDIWALPIEPKTPASTLKPNVVLQTIFIERDAQLTADGHWMLYGATEGRSPEIYVTPFPPSSGAPKLQVSAGLGSGPFMWRRDGKEIFYISSESQLTAAEMMTQGGTLQVSKVRPLFRVEDVTQSVFDVSPDGQRFILAVAGEQKTSQPMTLIQNWTAAIKK